MKKQTNGFLLLAFLVLLGSCTSQKELAYLNNLPEIGGESTFTMEIPEYLIQNRDILYITIKAMTPDGRITDFLSQNSAVGAGNYTQNESGQYLFGYDVNSLGNIDIPVLGSIKVAGLTLEASKQAIQNMADTHFNDATVECKLLSFKFTVIGEVKVPGSYTNFNNYLTVFEAIGRAGGIGDFGKRDRVLVIRPTGKVTKTFTLNLQDKEIIKSEAYFLLPNDVVIVEPQKHKIFNMNLPTVSFVLTSITSAITTTLLLINYLK